MQYLLDAKFGSDLNRNFGGRYKGVIEAEDPNLKLKRGLAEIHMLDTQLLQITKKASFVNKQGFLTDLDVNSTPTTNNSAAPSAASTPRSETTAGNYSLSSARGQAATFLTRVKGSVGQFRTTNAEKDTGASSSNEPADEPAPQEYIGDGKKEQAGKNFIADNIKAVHGPSRLAEEEEYRVKMLVECADDELENFLRYPTSEPQFMEDLNRIDDQLAQYHRLDRLQDNTENIDDNVNVGENSNNANGVGAATSDSKAKKTKKQQKKQSNEVEQQRLQREKAAYEDIIDAQLRICKPSAGAATLSATAGMDGDLTGLVECSAVQPPKQVLPVGSSSSASLYSAAGSVEDYLDMSEFVPTNVSRIRTARLITMQEVNKVSLCH
jgi:hypothetical protein